MQAQLKVRPTLIVTVEAESQKELFQQLASATEVFGERACGLCGNGDILFAWRTVTQGKKVFEYPEYHCQNRKCNARLSIGSMMEGGGLFPIRKLTKDGQPSREKGEYGPHNGWTRFKGHKPGEEGDESAA